MKLRDLAEQFPEKRAEMLKDQFLEDIAENAVYYAEQVNSSSGHYIKSVFCSKQIAELLIKKLNSIFEDIKFTYQELEDSFEFYIQES